MDGTKIVDIDLACDIKASITVNDDITVDKPLKDMIMKVDDNALLKVVKVIGSPMKIIKADIVTDDFLIKDLMTEE